MTGWGWAGRRGCRGGVRAQGYKDRVGGAEKCTPVLLVFSVISVLMYYHYARPQAQLVHPYNPQPPTPSHNPQPPTPSHAHAAWASNSRSDPPAGVPTKHGLGPGMPHEGPAFYRLELPPSPSPSPSRSRPRSRSGSGSRSPPRAPARHSSGRHIPATPP